jgi:hypothetical protein
MKAEAAPDTIALNTSVQEIDLVVGAPENSCLPFL